MRRFVERVSSYPIRYIFATHYHADHVNGLYLFPEAEAICHRRCRELLLRFGQRGLDEAKRQTPELAEVVLRVPRITFDESVSVRLGGLTITAMHAPGHSPDVSMVLVREPKVLFASDTMMPVPYIAGGDLEAMIQSLEMIGEMSLECVVQGHGEVLLRGEIKDAVESNIAYLRHIQELARSYVEEGKPKQALLRVDIESCGKSRLPLGGLVQALHRANLAYLYDRYRAELTRQAREAAA